MADHLFVYGTLQPDRAPPGMRDVVGRFRPVGAATVRGRLYDLGAYPGLVLDDAAGPVSGLVMDVPADDGVATWARLDAYEGFSADAPGRSLFRRVRCDAVFADGSGRAVECWTYVYNGDLARARRIDAGLWGRAADAAGQLHKEQTIPVQPHRRPLIGVTLDAADDAPRYALTFDYAASIERAGGIPFPIPYRTDLALIPEVVDHLAGVLFTGGSDLDPALYGESFHPRAEPIDPDRQRFELALLAEVERRRMPALGVCLGSQLMNVYRGGSLHQFLPDLARDGALEHRKLNDDGRRHAVRIEPGTILAGAIGQAEIVANTRHKQSIRQLGRGLRANAYAPDGVIEGIEDPTMPLYLAVQWHPENLSAQQPEHLAPFKLLVERARG